MRQLPAPTTAQAMRNATSNYDKWSRNQDFVRAQREGRVQYVVHVHMHEHTGTVSHIHYNGGAALGLGEGW